MTDYRTPILTMLLGSSLTYIAIHQKADASLPTPSIGFAANPVVSAGGSVTSGQSIIVFTAPSDQDIIVTDLNITSYSTMSCKRNHHTRLTLGSGTTIGAFETHSSISRGSYSSSAGLSAQHALSSGIRIPAGDTLSISTDETGYDGASCGTYTNYGVRYMLSGHYAQP